MESGIKLLRFIIFQADPRPAQLDVFVNYEDSIENILTGDVREDALPVISLGLALPKYTSEGVVIVAAAGNNASARPQAPAAYPEVIGVAATNYERGLACFSNPGDVAAPGGDGEDVSGLDYCKVNMQNQCTGQGGSCEDGIIGLVNNSLSTDTTPIVTIDKGYAYWAGTYLSGPAGQWLGRPDPGWY